MADPVCTRISTKQFIIFPLLVSHIFPVPMTPCQCNPDLSERVDDLHFSRARTALSRSLCLFSNCFLVCFRSFSSRFLIAFNSSCLISPAFFTTLGICLCLLIRRISGYIPVSGRPQPSVRCRQSSMTYHMTVSFNEGVVVLKSLSVSCRLDTLSFGGICSP